MLDQSFTAYHFNEIFQIERRKGNIRKDYFPDSYIAVLEEGHRLDDLLNTEVEKPAIGLLICKEKNAVLARYALSGMNRPMGISEYEVARQQLPDDLKKALPSTDEIEAGLNRM